MNVNSDIVKRADEIYTKYIADYTGEEQAPKFVNRLMARAVISAFLEQAVAAHQDAFRRQETDT